MYKMIKTVGELKNILNGLPNDMLILSYSSNMEKNGYENKMLITIEPMKETEKETYDAFDYTPYTYKVFELDATGHECLLFQ